VKISLCCYYWKRNFCHWCCYCWNRKRAI